MLLPLLVTALATLPSPTPALQPDIGQSRQVLTELVETEHFQVHYRPGSRAGASVDRTAHQVEREYSAVLALLGLEGDVDESEPFLLFVYDSLTELAELTGVGGTAGFASGREVHLPWDNDQTRQHEIVHIIVAAVKSSGSEERNMFFAEGIANATLRFVHGIPVHSVAAYELERGSLPSLKEMVEHPDFYRFLGENPGLNAYDVGGSFFLYLLETHSAKRVMDFVKGKPMKKALGKSMGQIERGWHAHLKAFEIRPELRTLLRQRRGDGGEFTEHSVDREVAGPDVLGSPEDWTDRLEELTPGDELGKWKVRKGSVEVRNDSGSDWSIAEVDEELSGNCVLRMKAELRDSCWGVKLRYGLECRGMLLGQGAFLYGPGGALASTGDVKLGRGTVDLILRIQDGQAEFYVNGELVLDAQVGSGPARPGIGIVGGRAEFTELSVRRLD